MTDAPAARRVAPGPPALPLVGHLPRFWIGDRLEHHLRDVEVYGDVVRYKVGPIIVTLVRHPDDVKHVLQDNHANYTKGRGVEKMKDFLGNGLLTSEGAFWLRQRRLSAPAFHRQRLEKLVAGMVAETEATLARFATSADATAKGDARVVDAAAEMMRLTLAIAAKTLFGADVSGDTDAVARALTVALEHTMRRTLSLIDLPRVPTPRNVRFNRAVRTLDGVVYGIIEKRRRTAGEDTGDLLSMLMLAKDEDTGETMSDKQLRDEVMTLVLAGHETTGNALAWTFYLLSKHPEVATKLHAEARGVLGDRSPTLDDLAKMPYSRMVIEESMRLYPPAWAVGRRAVADDEVGGYFIPARSLVLASPWVTHRHAKFWSSPEGFDPERFTPDLVATRPRYAYFPFGGGPRVCIGNGFAMMEAQIILAMTARHYRLDLVPGSKVEPQALVTLRPRHGVPVTIHRA